MTDKEAMLQAFERDMISKVYGFCRQKLSSPEDAEDLSQDICVEKDTIAFVHGVSFLFVTAAHFPTDYHLLV